MELIAKVEEVERANLREGQEAVIRLDALPGREVKGTVKRLGTTASMNVFRGEATKKFDAILAIDMRQLLQNVGAKPEQIERILATARVNAAQGFGPARQAAAAPEAAQAGEGGQRRVGGGQGGMRIAQGGGPAGGAEGQGGMRVTKGGGPGGAGGQGGGQRRQMSPEMQKKLQELTGGKDISELSQEERQKVFQQMRAQMGGQAGGGQGGARAGGPGGGGAPGEGGGRVFFAGPGPGGGPGGPPAIGPTSTGAEFTAEQRKAATLPQPPEEGSDVEILLRPGLLADAQIIVDSMKDVLYVPFQAVFDTPQGPMVYFWNGVALEPRKVELGSRSESQVVIAAGLEEGDKISLEPPAGDGDEREKKTPKKKSGAGKTGVPAAGPAIGGGRGGRI
jgi:hypothetical protein